MGVDVTARFHGNPSNRFCNFCTQTHKCELHSGKLMDPQVSVTCCSRYSQGTATESVSIMCTLDVNPSNSW